MDDQELPQPVPVPERVPDGPVQLADRVFRPLAPDRTEVTICIAPRVNPRSPRRRIRQYEDFFSASGMATPDGLEEFRACQEGFMGTSLPWNDMSVVRPTGSKARTPEADRSTSSRSCPASRPKTKASTSLSTYWLEQMHKALQAEEQAQAE